MWIHGGKLWYRQMNGIGRWKRNSAVAFCHNAPPNWHCCFGSQGRKGFRPANLTLVLHAWPKHYFFLIIHPSMQFQLYCNHWGLAKSLYIEFEPKLYTVGIIVNRTHACIIATADILNYLFLFILTKYARAAWERKKKCIIEATIWKQHNYSF